MDSTVSVSKGVFLFKNGFNKKVKSSKKASHSLFQRCFKLEPWYIAFMDNWNQMEHEIQELNNRTYSLLLNDIVMYIKSFYTDNKISMQDGIVPSATLLTGVNKPDHVSQFDTLINKIREEVTPHIAMVHSQDAPTIKHLVENTVWQLIHGHDNLDISDGNIDDIQSGKKMRKNQCNLSCLRNWYETKYAAPKNLSPTKRNKHSISKKSLVIIIPDFECFNSSVLQDLVMIMSSYVPQMPVIFVFGVATSVSALHKSFPYHVSSKLLIKVFYSHSSPVYMNQVLENIFLTHQSPFHLSGKAFQLMTDVFLFYDFSVTGLIQSIKYCLMDHFYGDNTKSLCCPKDRVDQAIINLTSEDLESIRHLPSFRPYIESQDCRTKIQLFEDDTFFRKTLRQEMLKLHDYLFSFYGCLRILYVFAKEIPKNILGKTIREMYTICATEDITKTPAFRECMQLLNFQSQIKLVDTLKEAIKTINNILQIDSPIKPFRSTPNKNNVIKGNLMDTNLSLGESFMKNVRVHLLTFLRHIQNANTEVTVVSGMDLDDGCANETENTPGNRYKLKEQLKLKATRLDKIQSEYEMVRSRFLEHLEKVFSKGLQPPQAQPFHEILFFDDVQNVKKQIIGSPRGAVHTALSNPVHYLQCKCCHLQSSESVAPTLLDVCLLYKLHRECGKHINLYDWLQAVAAILQPSGEEDDERRTIDPVIQLRFTRAVSELQFLGFIKASKRKTDHVMRLTW